MSTKVIGENLGRLLDEKGITREQFAEMAGVSAITVYRWINGGIGRTSIEMLFRIAKLLDTNVDTLVKEVKPCTDDAKSAGKN